MLTMTYHAIQRMTERTLTTEQIARALAGRMAQIDSETILLYDKTTRCTIIVNTRLSEIVTAYRMSRGRVKRTFGRGRERWAEA